MEMYGGDSSTSAYMLQYRKYDPTLKPHLGAENEEGDEEKTDRPWQNIVVSDDLIPDYLKKDIEKETDEMVEKQKLHL